MVCYIRRRSMLTNVIVHKIRAVLCGLLIGTVMCFSNMYFGLQTGWISMMSLQSSLLGYAMFKPFKGKLRRAFGPIENVVLQTTAVATATMPLAAGTIIVHLIFILFFSIGRFFTMFITNVFLLIQS
jgi:uncharacterized oligopeptide transporter (OPT) family protein